MTIPVTGVANDDHVEGKTRACEAWIGLRFQYVSKSRSRTMPLESPLRRSCTGGRLALELALALALAFGVVVGCGNGSKHVVASKLEAPSMLSPPDAEGVSATTSKFWNLICS